MIAGLDISTKAIHICSLPEDTNEAQLHVVRLDTERGDVTERIRRLRDRMPSRGAWRDEGYTLIAIERPYFAAQSIGPMMAVYGALLQLFPANMPLLELKSDEWRKACGLRLRKRRDEGSDVLKRESVAFAREQWRDPPPLDHDAAEAFAIAYAAREIDLRREAAA